VTNGQVVDEIFADRLSKYKGIEVGISFHSIKEDVQNTIAKSSQSYSRILNAIKCLEKQGIGWYSQMSLIKENYLEIEDMHSFLNSIGTPLRMDLSRMVECGLTSSQFLNENEYKQVFEQISRLDLEAIPVRIEAFPRCWLKKVASEKHLNYDKIRCSVRPCYAWVGQVSIDVFGNIRMCPTGGAVAGNVFKSGIKELWNSSREIKEFQKFNWQKEECRDCEDFAFCVGACKMTCRGQYPAPDKYIIEGGMHYASNNE
jgi:radical SAM protein with 4Fe4S-binding SPASM domain